MTVSIGAYQAKTHLSDLLAQVEGGESVTITKHGRPIARLVPVKDAASDPRAAVEALLAARAGVRLDGDSVREMIDEGRR